MQVRHVHGWMRFVAAGVVLTAGVLAVTGVFPNAEKASAQIGPGRYWLIQPGVQGHGGFACCNADRTVEYWAYVDGTYTFASPSNGSNNRWRLDAEYIASGTYSSFQAFEDAVCAMGEFQGKTLLFQDHSVTENVIEN
ncbi:MAG: hypothetical protein K8T90_03850 [Planctomycetes bacterium]|nr:hypothetical protein [Planctomycetota bacterium]